jgi:hypothetical protein
MGTMHLATTQGASTSENAVMRQQRFTLAAVRSLLLMVGFLSIELGAVSASRLAANGNCAAIHRMDCCLEFSLTGTIRRAIAEHDKGHPGG